MARAKYQEWLEPDSLLKLEAWARDGLIDDQIAKNIGITARTLYEWKKKYVPIAQSLKRGKEVIDYEVESALYKRAIGYEVEEEKIYIQDIEGRTTKRKEITKKHIPGDTTAQIFWLKNRKPEEWRDRKETALSGEVKTSTNPFDGIDTEVLEKLAENAKQSI